MGWQFRKSKSLGKGVRLNAGKKSIGVSAGVKGARVGINSKGRAGINLSIPGTGIRYRKSIKIGNGGIVGGMCTVFVSIFYITFLLCVWCFKMLWWMCKCMFYLVYLMFLYMYRGIVSIVHKIAERLHKPE